MLELELCEVNSKETFLQFWWLLVEDFEERGLSWSGHCMYGLLDLFPKSILDATEHIDDGDPNLTWNDLAEIFKEFRRQQWHT